MSAVCLLKCGVLSSHFLVYSFPISHFFFPTSRVTPGNRDWTSSHALSNLTWWCNAHILCATALIECFLCRVVCHAKAKTCTLVCCCSCRLTHIQRFLQLSNNVGIFYPKNNHLQCFTTLISLVLYALWTESCHCLDITAMLISVYTQISDECCNASTGWW